MTPEREAELRDFAEKTLNQGEGPWLPYEEAWHELAIGALELLDALEECRQEKEAAEKALRQIDDESADSVAREIARAALVPAGETK